MAIIASLQQFFQNYCTEQMGDSKWIGIFGNEESRRTGNQDLHTVVSPPATVYYSGQGTRTWSHIEHTPEKTLMCPHTHFLCPGLDVYCLPVYLRCNGVSDCPGHEDEVSCNRYTCPGFYRCRGSTICLHLQYVCDAVFHCPQQDDELFCGLICPVNCSCHGHAFKCHTSGSFHSHPYIRFLDASYTQFQAKFVAQNIMLVFLNVSNCHLEEIQTNVLPNIRILDASHNALTVVYSRLFESMPNLHDLRLGCNPLSVPWIMFNTTAGKEFRLKSLDLSGTHLPVLDPALLSVFPDIRTLNLSHCGVDHVLGTGFQSLRRLVSLDITGCPLSFAYPDMMQGLTTLDSVSADNFKMCCPAMLPEGFNPINCLAPESELSTCKDLLASNFYRTFLVAAAILALGGNLISLVMRMFIMKISTKSSFHVFITHLCGSDLLMGVYLVMIGTADLYYKGNYLWEERTWRYSVTCKIAGMLSLLSSEVSTFIVCWVTLDRFLALRFPFSQIRFNPRSSQFVMLVTWILGCVLVIIPVVPMPVRREFYGQTGVCISLPLSTERIGKWSYSFGVMIVLNSVLSLLIALGQFGVYMTVTANTMLVKDTRRLSRDHAVARRLFIVVMTNFFCWSPICFMGLLAESGFSIPNVFNVAIAIFVLPLNSAINPFLYTVNVFLERRRKKEEERILKQILGMMALNCS